MIGKEIYIAETQKIAPGSADVDLVLRHIPKNRIASMQYVTVECETTTCSRIMIGVKSLDQIQWLADQIDPTAGTKYWLSDAIPVDENEEIIARFIGTTQNDILSLTARGWMRKNDMECNHAETR